MSYNDSTGMTLDNQSFGAAAVLFGRAVLGDGVPDWALDPDEALPLLGGTVHVFNVDDDGEEG